MVGSRWNCCGGRYEANIYSKTYTEGSGPFEPLQLTAKAALKEGADMIDAALVSYGDIAAAPVDALATMVAEKDAPRVIIQGILDYDDLPAAGETKEVVIPLTRPKFKKQIGTLTLLVRG